MRLCAERMENENPLIPGSQQGLLDGTASGRGGHHMCLGLCNFGLIAMKCDVKPLTLNVELNLMAPQALCGGPVLVLFQQAMNLS